MHHRAYNGGHRSMPGVADLHPQEVVVKVQVTHRSNAADAGSKPGLAHVKGQQGQKQGQQEQQQEQQKQQQEEAQQSPAAMDYPAQQSFNTKSSRTEQAELGICQDAAQEHMPARPSSSCSSRSSLSTCSSADSSSSRAAATRVVPLLDLSRAQLGKGAAMLRGVPDPQPLTRTQAARDAELCLDHSSKLITLHPNAPMQDTRCYHYRAIGTKVGRLLHPESSRCNAGRQQRMCARS